MAKVTVGVDLARSCQVAIDIVESLGIATAYDLVNVVEPILPDGSFPELSVSNPVAQILDDLTEAGRKVTSDMAAELTAKGRTVTTQVVFGPAGAELATCAANNGCDVVAIGSQSKSIVASLFTGSVGRALAIGCKSSVLVAKQEVPKDKPLVLVFAHDLSSYADRAVETFVSWAPKNVQRIVLVTADATDPALAAIAASEPSGTGATTDSVRAVIESRQAAVCQRLAAIGCPVEAVVTEGNPKDAIREAMEASGADLLVMGAQGHGFIERLIVGSVALHQVVREPHNVLIVRP